MICIAGGLKGSWEALWQNLFRDHGHAGLIWNERTRSELLEALHVRKPGWHLTASISDSLEFKFSLIFKISHSSIVTSDMLWRTYTRPIYKRLLSKAIIGQCILKALSLLKTWPCIFQGQCDSFNCLTNEPREDI